MDGFLEIVYLCRLKKKIKMETVTLTFNSNSPFAANLNAFLKTVPSDVIVSKSLKTKRKRRSNYQITLDTIKEAREGKNVTHYASVDELFETLGI